jgi:hypothetical protein
MLDEATRQVRARLDFAAQENVLHEALAALNRELLRARDQQWSAAQWEAALLYMRDLSDAVEGCRMQVQALMSDDWTPAEQPDVG